MRRKKVGVEDQGSAQEEVGVGDEWGAKDMAKEEGRCRRSGGCEGRRSMLQDGGLCRTQVVVRDQMGAAKKEGHC